MKSESPRKAILVSLLTSSDVGGDQEFGRLVAAAALSGMTVQQFAEEALISHAMDIFGVSEEKAIRLLRVLESGQKGASA